MLMLSMSLVMIPLPLEEAAGLKPAWAASPAGILGQPAPEPGLDTWIDGSGRARPPIRLADHHGMVVVLYFFQDW